MSTFNADKFRSPTGRTARLIEHAEIRRT